MDEATQDHAPFALALGSGSARGFAHIGVLAELGSAGFIPDLITGSSIGAVAGAFYSAGYSASDLIEVSRTLQLRRLFPMADLQFVSAFVSGDGIEAFLRAHLPPRFEDLERPFACVSSDLLTGSRILHTDGDLVEAIMGSISIPVIFPPVEVGDRLLADGGLTEPVPVEAAKERGAEKVVAVTLTGVRSRIRNGREQGLLDRFGPTRLQIGLTAAEVMQRRISLRALEMADVVIAPDVIGFSQLALADRPPLIARGREAAREALPDLEASLRATSG